MKSLMRPGMGARHLLRPSRVGVFGEPRSGVDDWDKSASFGVGAVPRRSTSSLDHPRLSVAGNGKLICSRVESRGAQVAAWRSIRSGMRMIKVSVLRRPGPMRLLRRESALGIGIKRRAAALGLLAGRCCGHPRVSVGLKLRVEVTANAARLAAQGTQSMCFLRSCLRLM